MNLFLFVVAFGVVYSENSTLLCGSAQKMLLDSLSAERSASLCWLLLFRCSEELNGKLLSLVWAFLVSLDSELKNAELENKSNIWFPDSMLEEKTAYFCCSCSVFFFSRFAAIFSSLTFKFTVMIWITNVL